MYFTAVSGTCEGADILVLGNIAHYADTKMRTVVFYLLDLNRDNCLRQADELAQFAQSTELDIRVKHFSRDVG